MAIQRTRQFLMEDAFPADFNLGMNQDAFRNLGLMSLPGAGTTVANPQVVSQLASQPIIQPAIQAPIPPVINRDQLQSDIAFQLFGAEDAPAPTVEDLYSTVLGRGSDPTGLEFWTNKLGPTVQKDEFNEFFQAARPELEQTGYVPLSQKTNVPTEVEARYPVINAVTPQEKTVTPTIPTSDLPPEVREIINRDIPGPSSVFDLAPEPKTVIPSVIGQDAREVIDAEKPVVNTANMPKFEGTPYDPKAYDNVLKQLTSQQQLLSSKGVPYTSTFGGAQETVQDMAKRLAAMGISDIRDFGMKHELPVEKVYETIEQDEGPALQFDTGKYRTIVGQRGYDSDGNPVFDYRDLTPEEVDKLKFKDGMGFLPVDQIKRADLKNSPYATTVYYNKKTGDQLDTRKFGGKAESGLFASSGAGEGYTNYRVVYDEKSGIPIFIPEKELSGMKEFVAKDLPGILSVLSFIPGAQPFVTAAQLAGGLAAGVDPGKLLKSVGTSLLASNIGKIGNTVLPQLGVDLPTSNLGKLAMDAGYSGLASLIRGGDLESALKSAGLSAAGSGISQLLPTAQPGEFDYGKIVKTLAPALADGKLSNADIFQLVSLLAKDEAKKNKTPGKP